MEDNYRKLLGCKLICLSGCGLMIHNDLGKTLLIRNTRNELCIC